MEPTFLDGKPSPMKRPHTEEGAAAVKRPLTGKAPIRVAGVPEHFNIPWHQALEQDAFRKAGVEVEWITEKLGTGAMIKRLKSGSADVVVALTEGLVRDIVSNESDIRLLGTYVSSPLCWAISTAGSTGEDAADILDGTYTEGVTVESLREGRWGVSRIGSGSHLMTTVLASERGWDLSKLKFEVKGSFENLRNSVNDGSTDAFMWETFTTKPFHDTGEVTRTGEFTTPWPCFMLAARGPTVDGRLDELQTMLGVINEYARRFMASPTSAKEVERRQGHKPEDAAAWFKTVSIAAERFVSEAALERVVDALRQTGGIKADAVVESSSLIDVRLAELRRDIKSMKLYHKPELVTSLHRRLAARKMAKGPLKFTDLGELDINLYRGIATLDRVVAELKIGADTRVINVGSGLGGPARYIAGSVGCQVLACELQADLHTNGLELTARTGLQAAVHHICGDFIPLSRHMAVNTYDVVLSWLTVLHMKNKRDFFKQCYGLLRPGGRIYIADFFEAKPLSAIEWKVLNDQVSCTSLYSSTRAYSEALESVGFKITTVMDVTADWRDFTSTRLAAFIDGRAKEVEVVGSDVYSGLESFYKTVSDLYAGGNLGGIEVVATKPKGW